MNLKIYNLLILFSLISFSLSAQIFTTPDTLLTTCNGYVADSGSISNGYSPNEDYSMTICPDSSGTHVELIFSSINIAQGDTLRIYDGTDNQANLLASYSDTILTDTTNISATGSNTSGCLNLHFTSDASQEANGWLAEINCFVVCQNIIATISTQDSILIDTNIIDICFGEPIMLIANGFYTENGTYYDQSDEQSTFDWVLGDGTQASGSNLSHTFSQAGGYLLQVTITDQFGCTSTNLLNQEIRVTSPPQFSINEDIQTQICQGDSLYITTSLNDFDPEASISVQSISEPLNFGYEGDSLALPDGTGATYETSITVQGFEPGSVLQDINDFKGICVVMEHSWMFDLDIMLTCPDGSQIILQNQEFIGMEVFLGEPFEDDDFDNPNPPAPGIGYEYCWTPDADFGTWTEFILEFGLLTLPSGNYSSFESLDNLVGCPLNGEWTLSVTDLWASDNGWIFDWNLIFCQGSIAQDSSTFELVDSYWDDDPSIIFQNLDTLCIAPDSSTTYVLNVIDELGCEYSDSISIEVIDDVVGSISGGLIFCEGESSVLTAEGGADVLWSTGESTTSIEVFESGVYSAIISNGGDCADTVSVLVEVLEIPIVFVQLDSVYCVDQTMVDLPSLPNFDIQYSGPGVSGFNFNPSLAGVGTHTINYTFTDPNGCQGFNSSTTTVEVCVNNTEVQKDEKQVIIAPNPSNGNFNLSFKNWYGQKAINVFNVQGQLLSKQHTDQNKLSINNLPAGVYIVHISDGKHFATQRVVVQ